jgi:hypothetical protein
MRRIVNDAREKVPKALIWTYRASLHHLHMIFCEAGADFIIVFFIVPGARKGIMSAIKVRSAATRIAGHAHFSS